MRKSTKKLSSVQEKSIAKELDGKVIPASGGLQTSANWKGDINTVEEKLECKITEKTNYTLKFEDLLTLRAHATKDGKIPVFIFEFKDKARYAVTFCGQKEKEKAFIDFDTTDKSYNMKESDLRNMSIKSKGPIIGIKFKDGNTHRFIIVQDFIKWQADKEFARAQEVMKEFK